MEILFATTNPAKLKNYAGKINLGNNTFVTLKDLNITEDVEENGVTPLENAVIKANFYGTISNLPTIGMDDGLFFYNVPEEIQPGNNVRRVNGKKLTDEEMINHYTSIVEKYGENGLLKGFFRRGIAIKYNDNIYTYEIDLPRIFSNKSSNVINEGFPLASIQFVEKYNKFKSELNEHEKIIIQHQEENEVIKFIENIIQNINRKNR